MVNVAGRVGPSRSDIAEMTTRSLLRSSVLRKQIVALTGLAMVGFILAHLAGNMLIFMGPKAFNHYAETLRTIPELLWVARLGLVAALLAHIHFTVSLVRENRRARGENSYAVEASKCDDFNFARKYMIFSGMLVFFFLALHLWDFTLSNKDAARGIIDGAAGNKSQGLYGVVWNGLSNPWRVIIYIAAVSCVGLHLSHGVQSMCQTIGLNHNRYTPLIRMASLALGALVAVGFSLIPIYVLLRGTPSL
jgi:succinate dehydrogenase / fumarate reductase cytochrome b subunit